MGYISTTAAKQDLAGEVFGSGRIFAYYDKVTKQCTALLKIESHYDGEAIDVGSEMIMSDPPDGEGVLEIANVLTDTAIYQENYVDVETKSLLRKPKIELSYMSDPDYDAEKANIVSRAKPYSVRITMIDYLGKPYTPPTPVQLKVKDRESLLTIRDPIITYRDTMVIEVKALVPGKNTCLRLKDTDYGFVPGLLNASVSPPAW